jgi:hypothetical protein
MQNTDRTRTTNKQDNIKDAISLIESGLEYITEVDGVKPSKKRK